MPRSPESDSSEPAGDVDAAIERAALVAAQAILDFAARVRAMRAERLEADAAAVCEAEAIVGEAHAAALSPEGPHLPPVDGHRQ